ncbi:hypothetical protein A6R68_09580, partial [Neotoma lepida]
CWKGNSIKKTLTFWCHTKQALPAFCNWEPVLRFCSNHDSSSSICLAAGLLHTTPALLSSPKSSTACSFRIGFVKVIKNKDYFERYQVRFRK